MAYRIAESFGWAGTTIAIFQTRYNFVTAGASLSLTGGRFANGPTMRISGSSARQDFNFPGAPTPTLRFGIALRSSDTSLFPSGTAMIGAIDGTTLQCYLCVNASSRLIELRRGTGNTLLATATSTPLQNNSYYYIEVRFTLSGTVGQVSVQVDGATVINTAANLNNISSGVAQASAVRVQTGSASQTNEYCDMFIADDVAAFQGDSRVTLLTPAADGAASAWTPSTGTTLFNLVDEIPPNGDTDYISSNTPTQQALFTFTDLTYTPATVFCVQTSLYARKDDAAVRSIAGLVRSGGTTLPGATYALTTSFLDIYLDVYANNPVTVAPWSVAEVNAIEAGVVCIA